MIVISQWKWKDLRKKLCAGRKVCREKTRREEKRGGENIFIGCSSFASTAAASVRAHPAPCPAIELLFPTV